MKLFATVVLAAAILSQVEATTYCSSTTTITTTPTGIVACPACLEPTTTCSSGEPSTRPFPTVTSDCTVAVIEECPCTTCLPGCTSTTTVTSSPHIHCDFVCPTPTSSTCQPGEPTGPPATNTITSGCTVSLIGKGCVGCASCVSPTVTPYN